MRAQRRWLASLTAAALVAMMACGSDDPAGPGLDDGDLTATIDGDEGTADVGTTRNTNVIGIGAGDGERAIGIGFVDAGAGVYPINATSSTNALITEDGKGWSASAVGGSGTITITSITAARVAGSFTSPAVPNAASGATGNRVVTDGEFDIEFQTAP